MKATRFTPENFTLLHLLSKGKTLDDLTLFEPEKSAKLLHYLQETKRIDKFAFIEKYGMDAYEYIRKHMDEVGEFLKHDGVTVYEDNAKRIEALEEDLDFGPMVDEVFTAKMPKAYYISGRTVDALNASANTLLEKAPDLLIDLPDDSGVIILHSPKLQCYPEPIYIFFTVKGGKLFYLTIKRGQYDTDFVRHREAELKKLDFCPNPYSVIDAQGNGLNLNDEQVRGLGPTGETMFPAVVATLLFIHFFQIEAVEIKSNSSSKRAPSVRKEVGGSTYDTTLTYPITIVDARWYTEVLRDDPFLVKGHLRKQPYGPGRSQYKMIWIAAFQKNGYHRKAKRNKLADPQTNVLTN